MVGFPADGQETIPETSSVQKGDMIKAQGQLLGTRARGQEELPPDCKERLIQYVGES